MMWSTGGTFPTMLEFDELVDSLRNSGEYDTVMEEYRWDDNLGWTKTGKLSLVREHGIHIFFER